MDIKTYKKLKYGLPEIEYQHKNIKEYESSLLREKEEAQKYLDKIAQLESNIASAKKIIQLAEVGEYVPKYLNSESEFDKQYKKDAEYHTWDITYGVFSTIKTLWEKNLKDDTSIYLEKITYQTITVTLPKDQTELTLPHHIYYDCHVFSPGQSYGSPSACTEWYGPDVEMEYQSVCVIKDMKKKWEHSLGHKQTLISILLSKRFDGRLKKRQGDWFITKDDSNI